MTESIRGVRPTVASSAWLFRVSNTFGFFAVYQFGMKPRVEELRMIDGTTRSMSGNLVLVVDDDPRIRTYIRKVLQRTGVHVLEAGDGIEALEVFQAWGGRIDLVITDIRMPRMTGTDLAVSLRSVSPTVPLIFVSSESVPPLMNDPKDGFFFIEKPFAPKALLNAAGQVLNRIPVAC